MLGNNVKNASQPSETKHCSVQTFLIFKVELNPFRILGQISFLKLVLYFIDRQ